jgi:threonine/homoserine/homoserine lactone efflux protein
VAPASPPLPLPALVAAGFVVSFVTVAIPGPITIVATRLGLSRHLGAAVWFLAGVTALDAALFSALAAGAAPVLRRAGALPVVVVLGGLALLWGGVSTLRDGAPPSDPTGRLRLQRGSVLFHFALGVAVSAGNPHYWIWWVTAGLAFVEGARAHGAPGLAWMLAALIGGVVTFYVPLLWALRRGRALLSPRVERVVTRSLGGVLVLLGIGLTALGAARLAQGRRAAAPAAPPLAATAPHQPG